MLIKSYRFRISILGILSLAAFAAVVARLYHLQVIRHEAYVELARKQQHKKVVLSPRRGEIRDRNGATLANSSITDSIVFDSRKLKEKASRELVADLAHALGKPVEYVQSRYFDRKGRHFVYRKAPEEVCQAISVIEDRHELPENTVVFEKHSKRYYPNGPLASHVLGFTRIDDTGDNIGQSGIELRHDSYLKGSYAEQRMMVNSRRKDLAPLDEDLIEMTHGHEVTLTIDSQIQMFTERALRRRVGELQAKSGVAIVMDVQTGAILALANSPDFNPNQFSRADPSQRLNRALTDPLEIGSVMKIITTTLLLDNNLLAPDELVDCNNGWTRIHGRTVKDDHQIGKFVPFPIAFAQSSNVAMALLSERLEPTLYYKGLRRFGLGRPTGLDLAGEGNGILRPVERWTAMSRASLAIGYEVALTPIQVVSALSAIGNKGWRMRPHLLREIRTHQGHKVKEFEPERIDRVASAEVCRHVLGFMEKVVQEGTGTNAQVPGYRIGGKTGTTLKHVRVAGRKRYIASFAGLAPIDDPRLAIFVTVDEPKGEKYGGSVSAPVFREVASQALHIFGVKPSDPAAYERYRHGRETPPLVASAQWQAFTGGGLPGDQGIAEEDQGHPEPFDRPSDPNGVSYATTRANAGPALPLLLEPDDAYSPEDAGTRPMPDCRGLTMIEAWDKLARAGIEAKMLGSGVAVRQEPSAGALIAADRAATVIFAHPSEAPKVVGSRPIGPAE